MNQAKNADEYIAMQRSALAGNAECGTSHYNLAVALMGKKEYEEAEHEFLEALDCSPTLAEAYVHLGGLRLKQNDLEGCLAYNQQSVKVRPGFSEGWGNIGFVLLQLGKVDEAITALEKATKFNFRFVQALTTLANAYLIKGRISESIETNLKVLELEGNFGVAHNNLTVAYLENNEPELAAGHCKKAVAAGYKVAPELLNELEAYL